MPVPTGKRNLKVRCSALFGWHAPRAYASILLINLFMLLLTAVFIVLKRISVRYQRDWTSWLYATFRPGGSLYLAKFGDKITHEYWPPFVHFGNLIEYPLAAFYFISLLALLLASLPLLFMAPCRAVRWGAALGLLQSAYVVWLCRMEMRGFGESFM